MEHIRPACILSSLALTENILLEDENLDAEHTISELLTKNSS
jgi:hypothetical protein